MVRNLIILIAGIMLFTGSLLISECFFVNIYVIFTMGLGCFLITLSAYKIIKKIEEYEA
jgi:hypothetical protein